MPDPSRAAGALLDVDGTLVDTNHLHALAWWRALRRYGKTYPMASIHRLIGMGGDKLVPELTGEEIDGADGAKPDADIFEVAMDRFGLDPTQTVAVGDSIWDAKAADLAKAVAEKGRDYFAR